MTLDYIQCSEEQYQGEEDNNPIKKFKKEEFSKGDDTLYSNVERSNIKEKITI